MSISEVTYRFLSCLDHLVANGKVKSKRHFALSIGYHAQGISEMTAQRRDVPLELIEKAVSTYKFNPLYLFTGMGNHFTEGVEDDGLRLKHLSVITDQQGEERIVHVPVPAQAGYGKFLDDPVFIQDLPTYKLPDAQFKSGTYRSFEISGNSMYPTFRPNDIVIAAFVEPRYWEQAIKNQQLYIIVTREEVIIKRIHNRIRNEKVIECISDNPEFDSYTININDILEVWKVRMKMTTYLDPPIEQNESISIQLRNQQAILEKIQNLLPDHIGL